MNEIGIAHTRALLYGSKVLGLNSSQIGKWLAQNHVHHSDTLRIHPNGRIETVRSARGKYVERQLAAPFEERAIATTPDVQESWWAKVLAIAVHAELPVLLTTIAGWLGLSELAPHAFQSFGLSPDSPLEIHASGLIRAPRGENSLILQGPATTPHGLFLAEAEYHRLTGKVAPLAPSLTSSEDSDSNSANSR